MSPEICSTFFSHREGEGSREKTRHLRWKTAVDAVDVQIDQLDMFSNVSQLTPNERCELRRLVEWRRSSRNCQLGTLSVMNDTRLVMRNDRG